MNSGRLWQEDSNPRWQEPGQPTTVRRYIEDGTVFFELTDGSIIAAQLKHGGSCVEVFQSLPGSCHAPALHASGPMLEVRAAPAEWRNR